MQTTGDHDMKKLILAALMMVMAGMPLKAAHADDDVFLDEGDGGFDTMAPSNSGGEPTLADDPFAAEMAPPKAAPKAAPKPAAPVPAKPVVAAKPAAPAPVVKPVAAQPKPEPQAPHDEIVSASAEPVASKEKKHYDKYAGGSYMTTTDACPMMRGPASVGAPMVVVKPAKKVWVEESDPSWVKAYNKAGEPGYLSKECFK
jgi:hypothetical protein